MPLLYLKLLEGIEAEKDKTRPTCIFIIVNFFGVLVDSNDNLF